MQTLDVISFNLWQMLISLANLALLVWILKKFLFRPVMSVLEKRQKELDSAYEDAEKEKRAGEAYRKEWEETLSQADKKANEHLALAHETAKRRSEKMVEEAKAQADGILQSARSEAEAERQKFRTAMHHEMVELSGALTEKLLQREVRQEDHRNLISDFIERIGKEDE